MKLCHLLRMLETKLAASISVEVVHRIFHDCVILKLAPDQYLHHAEICRRHKLHDHNEVCAANKTRSVQVAQRGCSFYGECPCGVWDYAQPVMLGRELIAVLYFTGSRERLAEIRKYATFTAALIQLECEAFLQSRSLQSRGRKEDHYVRACQHFIAQNYQRNIGLAELAEELNLNPNYLGPILLRETGMTFREHLMEKRLHESLIYLELHPLVPIYEIAMQCGFSDSNYFSTVFKRHFGCTPFSLRRGKRKAYQKAQKEAVRLLRIKENGRHDL